MRMVTRLGTCTLDNRTSKTLSLVQAMRNMNGKSRKHVEKGINIEMVMQKLKCCSTTSII
jgi:hypothetical protein